jgi:protein-disulfide isomerase
MTSNRRVYSTASRRARRPAPAARAGSRRTVLIVAGLAVLAAAALIVAGVISRRQEASVPIQASLGAASVDRGLGLATAPVTIVEYADMQCPVCARSMREIEPQINNEFIKSGIVRLEYRHFAFLGRESQRAAEACECAGEQGQFLRYRDTVLRNQAGENRGGFSDARLREIAGVLGLDTDAFRDCLASGRYTNEVKRQTEAGTAQGVRSTPTFFVNGRMIQGLAPYEAFRQAILQAAQTAGRAP